MGLNYQCRIQYWRPLDARQCGLRDVDCEGADRRPRERAFVLEKGSECSQASRNTGGLYLLSLNFFALRMPLPDLWRLRGSLRREGQDIRVHTGVGECEGSDLARL
jgi:hypothetical protein